MYRIQSFKNAQEFQELFCMREHNNGIKSRRNAILLKFIQSPAIWKWCRENDYYYLVNLTDMMEMKSEIMRLIRNNGKQQWRNGELNYVMNINGICWYSNKYETDNLNGICLDGVDDSEQSGSFIRYRNKKNGKIYKMKSGKMFKHLIECNRFGRLLPEQVRTWMIEQLVQEWKVYVHSQIPKYELNVNNEFWRIYDGSECYGDFKSCMTNRGFEDFYTDSVSAKAAYLIDKDKDMIIARCVIFTDAKDDDGKTWRLCERQYATDGNDLLKQLLVTALINAGEIDAYKRVGADCGNSTAFIDIEGNSLHNKRFHINCDLEYGNTCSYQDSFKFYDPVNKVAYNDDFDDFDDDDYLCMTDGTYYGSRQAWDDWNERFCRRVVRAYVNGETYKIDEDWLEEGNNDFRYFNGNWYHEDDILECERCGNEFLSPEYYDSYDTDGCHSDVTGESYCCEDCMEEAEKEYKKANWYFSDLDKSYVPKIEMLENYIAFDEDEGGMCIRSVINDRVSVYVMAGVLHYYNNLILDTRAYKEAQQQDAVCEELIRMYEEENA